MLPARFELAARPLSRGPGTGTSTGKSSSRCRTALAPQRTQSTPLLRAGALIGTLAFGHDLQGFGPTWNLSRFGKTEPSGPSVVRLVVARQSS